MAPETFRKALIMLYGKQGYIDQFACQTGKRRQTIYRWLRNGNIPLWATHLLTLLIREKKRKEGSYGQTGTT